MSLKDFFFGSGDLQAEHKFAWTIELARRKSTFVRDVCSLRMECKGTNLACPCTGYLPAIAGRSAAYSPNQGIDNSRKGKTLEILREVQGVGDSSRAKSQTDHHGVVPQ